MTENCKKKCLRDCLIKKKSDWNLEVQPKKFCKNIKKNCDKQGKRKICKYVKFI